MTRRKTFKWRGRLGAFKMKPFRGSMRWAAFWALFVAGRVP